MRPWQWFSYQPFTKNYQRHSIGHQLNASAEKHNIVVLKWHSTPGHQPSWITYDGSKIKLETKCCAPAQHKLCHVCLTLHTFHMPHPNSCPFSATNFKWVLVEWEEKLMQIPGCHCWFILLAYAQALLAERLLVQLSSLNWLPDPAPL